MGLVDRRNAQRAHETEMVRRAGTEMMERHARERRQGIEDARYRDEQAYKRGRDRIADERHARDQEIEAAQREFQNNLAQGNFDLARQGETRLQELAESTMEMRAQNMGVSARERSDEEMMLHAFNPRVNAILTNPDLTEDQKQIRVRQLIGDFDPRQWNLINQGQFNREVRSGQAGLWSFLGAMARQGGFDGN